MSKFGILSRIGGTATVGRKISYVIGLCLALVVGVAATGIVQMQAISVEIEGIAERDVPLTNTVTAITIHQLEQAINFERALRYGEEMRANSHARASFEKAVNDFETVLAAHFQEGVIDHIVTPRLCGDCATGFNFAGDVNVRGNIVAYHRIGHPNSIVFPPHEMGHVFFLYHPFETQFGIECTSGSNCATAGDLVCDTPASTAVFGGGNSGNTTATGIYFANQPGPCVGDPPYNPNTRLYMEAGWQAGHTLRDRFSPGELAVMVNWLLTRLSDLVTNGRSSSRTRR